MAPIPRQLSFSNPSPATTSAAAVLARSSTTPSSHPSTLLIPRPAFIAIITLLSAFLLASLLALAFLLIRRRRNRSRDSSSQLTLPRPPPSLTSSSSSSTKTTRFLRSYNSTNRLKSLALNPGKGLRKLQLGSVSLAGDRATLEAGCGVEEARGGEESVVARPEMVVLATTRGEIGRIGDRRRFTGSAQQRGLGTFVLKG